MQTAKAPRLDIAAATAQAAYSIDGQVARQTYEAMLKHAACETMLRTS